MNEFITKAREYLLQKELAVPTSSSLHKNDATKSLEGEAVLKNKAQSSMYETLSRYIIGSRSAKGSPVAVSPRASPVVETEERQKVPELFLTEPDGNVVRWLS